MPLRELKDLHVLDREEIFLLKALIHLKMLDVKQADEFLTYRKERLENSKKYLGQVLIGLGYISQADIDEYINENRAGHEAFINMLGNEGYLSGEQKELVFTTAKEKGSDLISVINDLNIMTRDNYSRIFNKRSSVLRLGEWLMVKHKITKEQMEEAIGIQKIVSIEDYLVHKKMVKREVIDKVKDKLAGMTA